LGNVSSFKNRVYLHPDTAAYFLHHGRRINFSLNKDKFLY